MNQNREEGADNDNNNSRYPLRSQTREEEPVTLLPRNRGTAGKTKGNKRKGKGTGKGRGKGSGGRATGGRATGGRHTGGRHTGGKDTSRKRGNDTTEPFNVELEVLGNT